MVKEVRFGWDDEFTPPPLDPVWDLDDPDWDDAVPGRRRRKEPPEAGKSNRSRRADRTRCSCKKRRQ